MNGLTTAWQCSQIGPRLTDISVRQLRELVVSSEEKCCLRNNVAGSSHGSIRPSSSSTHPRSVGLTVAPLNTCRSAVPNPDPAAASGNSVGEGASPAPEQCHRVGLIAVVNAAAGVEGAEWDNLPTGHSAFSRASMIAGPDSARSGSGRVVRQESTIGRWVTS